MRDVDREVQEPDAAPEDAESDAVEIARALRSAGPLHFGELRTQSEVAGWSASRLENAVVSAWSQKLIYVDSRDYLVAL